MEEKTHWLQSPNKNYLGHWDLPESGQLTLTIDTAEWEEVKNPVINTSEAKRVVRFKEKGVKPFICNQTNAQSILKSTGIKFMEDSSGQRICLFVTSIVDKKTKEYIDCIRVKQSKIQKEKPTLTKDHRRFAEAQEAWNTGKNEGVLKQFIITKEMEDFLNGVS